MITFRRNTFQDFDSPFEYPRSISTRKKILKVLDHQLLSISHDRFVLLQKNESRNTNKIECLIFRNKTELSEVPHMSDTDLVISD